MSELEQTVHKISFKKGDLRCTVEVEKDYSDECVVYVRMQRGGYKSFEEAIAAAEKYTQKLKETFFDE